MASAAAMASDTRFLAWLEEWRYGLGIARIERPERAAVVVVDMVNGFCRTGNLASERVGGLIAPVVRVLDEAHTAGVRDFLIAEDTHRPNDREFGAFPPHCIRGSGEERTVEEIRSLPFSSAFRYFPKPSINISVGTDMDERLGELLNGGTEAFVVVGDCTDLCVYQAATHLRFLANARDADARVIVPTSAVDTYDVPVGAGTDGLPHPGDLLHGVFLYHMALLGCEVVAGVAWGAAA